MKHTVGYFDGSKPQGQKVWPFLDMITQLAYRFSRSSPAAASALRHLADSLQAFVTRRLLLLHGCLRQTKALLWQAKYKANAQVRTSRPQVKIDYRPVHEKPMTKDMPNVPPKARTY